MAAVTPTSVSKYNIGDTNLITATFAGPSNGDTWTSNITGVAEYWYQVQATPGTQASAGADVILTTASTGLFTLGPGENAKAGKLFIMVRN